MNEWCTAGFLLFVEEFQRARFGFGGSGRPKHVYEGTAGLPPHQTLSLSIMSRLVLRRLPMMIGPMLPLLGAPGNRQDSRRRKSQKTDIGVKKPRPSWGLSIMTIRPTVGRGSRQNGELRPDGPPEERTRTRSTRHNWDTVGDWTHWRHRLDRLGSGRVSAEHTEAAGWLAGWLAVPSCPARNRPPPHRHGSAPPRAVTGR